MINISDDIMKYNFDLNEKKLNNEKRKTKKKTIFTFLITFVLCLLIVFWMLFGFNVSHNIERYDEALAAVDALPKLNELGDYNDLYFKYYQKRMLIFQSDAYILKASYDKSNYEKQKEALFDKYIFQTNDLEYNDHYKKPTFECDTFNFNVLDVHEYDLFYPKSIVFIGYSDNNEQIAYIYFYDFDLDLIDTSFEEFLKKYCGW